MYIFVKKLVFLVSGIFIGSFLCLILTTKPINYENPSKTSQIFQYPKAPSISDYENFFTTNKYRRETPSLDSLRYGTLKYKLESDLLHGLINILCVVFVKNEKNAEAARQTWAKHCNSVKFIHISTKKSLKLNTKSKRVDSKWFKLCSFLKNEKNASDAKWVIFVNDQTFVIIENLRLFVAPKRYTERYYFGQPIKFWNTIYNSGESGYVISRGTLKVLQENLQNNTCDDNTMLLNKEDLYLGKLLSSLDIGHEDTRDSLGFSRFHMYNWQQEFFLGLNYYKTNVFPVKCCSIYTITFKGIDAEKFYMYYYLIYQLKVFQGGHLGSKPIITQKDTVWKTFLKEQGIVNRSVSSQEYYKIWEDLVQDPESFLRQNDVH